MVDSTGTFKPSPWGPISIYTVDNGIVTDAAYVVKLSSVPTAACARVGQREPSSYAKLSVNGASVWAAPTTPPDPATVLAACNASANTV